MGDSSSYEKLGTNAYGYVTVVDENAVRQTGLVIGDFSIELYDPDDVEISGSVSITVSEFQVSGSPTGAYRFTVPIPDGDEGSYTLIITDPENRVHTCVFLAYTFRQGDTGDTTAQMEITIRNLDGSIPSGIVIGDLTVRIYDPDMTEVSGSVSPTLTELADGQFRIAFDIGSGADEGDWFIDIIDATRFPQGQQGVWIYHLQDYEGSSSPTLSTAVNDGTGTSATLTYVADAAADVIYTYYRVMGESSWTLAGQTRTGSGTIQITGLSAGPYDFYGVASQSGSPIILQSPPSNVLRVTVASSTSSAATDNVRVAVRAMKQKAVYWPPSELDDFGKPTWGTAVEIDCRWEDVQEQFINSNGETALSRAKLIVDRDLENKGVLWLGELDDVVDINDPKDNPNAWEILRFMKTPDFKGRRYLREVLL